jgi:benzoyl-CoA reductase subunit A
MDAYVGIDLGSTTTKAVFLDEHEKLLGFGITNSRSDYDIACQIAREEAEINSRFAILRRELRSQVAGDGHEQMIAWLYQKYRLAQHNRQLEALAQACRKAVDLLPNAALRPPTHAVLEQILSEMQGEAVGLFTPGAVARSDFFRDVAASSFLHLAEKKAGDDAKLLDRLIGTYDKSILQVEAKSYTNAFADYIRFAADAVRRMPEFEAHGEAIARAVTNTIAIEFRVLNTIGTGYGRQRLPFPKEQIRSEILCHGLGAHFMFPKTRTVLDIGGQDTKAIQVDENGIVTNFQMNDRCAAGCGRYLGYIADEMNVGLHELGPLAMKSRKQVKINSTCTVFAGAELRERLALGERREDMLAGLHRAIILRAMSLLARSGGVVSEFTFTGGVAKNQAATDALRKLIAENYGEMTINISPDSIFTGAIGAALFAKRDRKGDLIGVDLKALQKPVKPTAQEQR